MPAGGNCLPANSKRQLLDDHEAHSLCGLWRTSRTLTPRGHLLKRVRDCLHSSHIPGLPTRGGNLPGGEVQAGSVKETLSLKGTCGVTVLKKRSRNKYQRTVGTCREGKTRLACEPIHPLVR